MNQTRAMQRSWGWGLMVIGLAGVVSSYIGDSLIASAVFDTLLILTGLLLPLPPGLEARLRGWRLPVRAVVLIGVLAVVVIALVGLSTLINPLVIPVGLLGAGIALWAWSARPTRP